MREKFREKLKDDTSRKEALYYSEGAEWTEDSFKKFILWFTKRHAIDLSESELREIDRISKTQNERVEFLSNIFGGGKNE